jgi:hypothetical protein
MGGKLKEFSQFIGNDDYPLALFDPTQFHGEFFERNIPQHWSQSGCVLVESLMSSMNAA